MAMACAPASSRISFRAYSGIWDFNHKAHVGLRSTQCTATTCVPTQTVKITGASMTEPQDRCHPFFGKHNRSGQRRSSRVTCIAISDDVALDEEEEKTVRGKQLDGSSPSTLEVHQLLTELCDETSIAELQLKVGSFKLNVKRKVGKKKGSLAASPLAAEQVPAAVPSPPVVSKSVNDSVPAAGSGPPKSKPQLSSSSGFLSSFSKPLSSTWALLESAADEGLLFVKSPKVGYFRTGRLVKGKRGKPLLEEGQIIKEGHIVCYLEQLGTQQPVESQISGEVVKLLWDDGEPVGYGDPLIAVRPSFPGIKKLT